MEPYRSYFPNAGLLLPETEKLTRKVIQMPTGTSVNNVDIEKVCNVIRFIINNGKKISSRIEQTHAK
jgi:dTDP-4-amino-4,6-dideoxygalactose transaminase